MLNARRLGLKLLDGLQYGVALVALFSAVVTPLTLLVWDDLVPLKWALFLLGMALLGFGTWKLWPMSAWKNDSRVDLQNSFATDGFGGLVGRLPPVAWFDPEPEDHLSDGGRFLLASLLAYLTSFLLEALLGVGVPTLG